MDSTGATFHTPRGILVITGEARHALGGENKREQTPTVLKGGLQAHAASI